MSENKIVKPNDVKAKYLSGGQWNARKLQKGLRASHESGKKKGLVPPALARYMAKANRSYKHPGYAAWSAKCQGEKIKWTGA